MKYVVALHRKVDDKGKITSQAHIEEWQTGPQTKIRTYKMPFQVQEKTYTPSGVYVCSAWQNDVIFVGTKTGVVRFEDGGKNIEMIYLDKAKDLIGRHDIKSSLSVVKTKNSDGSSFTHLIWLPYFELPKQNKGVIGLFDAVIDIDAKETRLEEIIDASTISEKKSGIMAPLGSLLTVEDGILLYSQITEEHGKILFHKQDGLYIATKRNKFLEALYPQPVNFSADTNYIYAIGKGTKENNIETTLFIFDKSTLEEIAQANIDISEVTAFTTFIGNYNIDKSRYLLSLDYEQKEPITYAILGQQNGNIALVEIKHKEGNINIEVLGKFKILSSDAENYLMERGKNTIVRNILIKQQKIGAEIYNAEILVQYDALTVYLKSYELLTHVAITHALKFPEETIFDVSRKYSENFRGNKNVAVFDSFIRGSDVLEKQK